MADIGTEEKLFRALVVNESLPGFFHFFYLHKFSFKTVFYKTTYYYCSCKCAFEHEFCLYISNTSEINEDMYERVVQNIVNGECPHVKTAAPEFVRETRVTAIHVTTAIGNKDAVRWFLENYDVGTLTDDSDDDFGYGGRDADTGIFKLQPFDIAASKNKDSIMTLFSTFCAIDDALPVPVLRRWDKDSDTIIVDVVRRREIITYAMYRRHIRQYL